MGWAVGAPCSCIHRLSWAQLCFRHLAMPLQALESLILPWLLCEGGGRAAAELRVGAVSTEPTCSRAPARQGLSHATETS